MESQRSLMEEQPAFNPGGAGSTPAAGAMT